MARKRRQPSEPLDTGDLLDARPVATLDLHGFTSSEAQLAVRNFLTTWARRSSGATVHVITGRGKGSGGKAVLRGAVGRLLASGEFAGMVAEYMRDVDDGGFLVRLKGGRS
ncbi:MAG TPA: Smr/MutS family protein [Gemmatimonadales bacterium]